MYDCKIVEPRKKKMQIRSPSIFVNHGNCNIQTLYAEDFFWRYILCLIFSQKDYGSTLWKRDTRIVAICILL